MKNKIIKLLLCLNIIIFFSCYRAKISGTINTEKGILPNTQLTFRIVKKNNTYKDILINVDRDGKFSQNVYEDIDGVMFVFSEICVDGIKYKDPSLISLYKSNVIIRKTVNLDCFYLLDADRNVTIDIDNNKLVFQWEKILFDNIIYSVVIYNASQNIVKEIFTKRPGVTIDVVAGGVDKKFDSLKKLDVDSVLIQKNEQIDISKRYTYSLAVYLVTETEIILLSLSKALPLLEAEYAKESDTDFQDTEKTDNSEF